MRIAKETVVAIDYTLTGADGKVIDSSAGGDPLVYLHGSGNIIPGLERALEGKSAGDVVDAVIDPEQGYGAKNDALVQELPRTQFPGVKEIRPGMQFEAQTNHGPRIVSVVGLSEDAVTIDANHPLAGATLNFEVKIVSVRRATPEELAHGHAHGPDGVQHH